MLRSDLPVQTRQIWKRNTTRRMPASVSACILDRCPCKASTPQSFSSFFQLTSSPILNIQHCTRSFIHRLRKPVFAARLSTLVCRPVFILPTLSRTRIGFSFLVSQASPGSLQRFAIANDILPEVSTEATQATDTVILLPSSNISNQQTHGFFKQLSTRSFDVVDKFHLVWHDRYQRSLQSGLYGLSCASRTHCVIQFQPSGNDVARSWLF